MTAEPAPSSTALPPLPNPAHPRNAGPLLSMNADEALRVMRLLSEEAANGTTDYPYPTTNEYPLPPLPAVPVPSRQGVSRRVRPPPPKVITPTTNPPIPSSSPLSKPLTLDQAISTHNEMVPPMPASLQYGRSALLVHIPDRGHCWALLQTLGNDEAQNIECLSVRFFPTRDPRPPPIHALPPQGPAHISSEMLSSLNLSVPALLWRLRCIGNLIDTPCFYCNAYLSDLDGLPMGCCGFLPGSQKTPGTAEEKDKDMAKDTEAKEKETEKDTDKSNAKEENGIEKVNEKDEAKSDDGEPEGRWVAWHPRCAQ